MTKEFILKNKLTNKNATFRFIKQFKPGAQSTESLEHINTQATNSSSKIKATNFDKP